VVGAGQHDRCAREAWPVVLQDRAVPYMLLGFGLIVTEHKQQRMLGMSSVCNISGSAPPWLSIA